MSIPENNYVNKLTYGDLIPIINALPGERAPLRALSQKVEDFMSCGPEAAFAAFQNLRESIIASSYRMKGRLIEIPVTSDLGLLSRVFSSNLNAATIWKTPTMASTLVLLLACPNDAQAIHEVATDQGRTFGGTPSIDSVRTTRSASLLDAYQRAKSAAMGGRSAVMVVTLHDVYSLESDEREDVGNYFPFSHFFAMCLGPLGVKIWQAGGHNGYGFDQYLREGHARLRSWDEAEKFATDFDALASHEGKWTEHINKLYQSLFLINVDRICGVNGPEPPVSPEFRAWVRIRTLENVTYEDVTKYVWVES